MLVVLISEDCQVAFQVHGMDGITPNLQSNASVVGLISGVEDILIFYQA